MPLRTLARALLPAVAGWSAAFAAVAADTAEGRWGDGEGRVVDVHGTRAVALDGRVHRLGNEDGVAAIALVFMNDSCPVSNRFAPELDGFHALARESGVDLYGVVSDPHISVAQARNFVEDYGIGFPVLFDGSGDLALRLDPVATPEVFVIGRDDRVVYRGRIDNRFQSIGVLRQRITEHDLKSVLLDLGRGRRLEPRRTAPVGCFFEAWDESLPEAVTYNRDIEPLLRANCVECHRAGGVAPFPLDSHMDAKRRAQMLALTTARGLMPPWRAAAGFGRFRDERRLSARQIALFGAWTAAGAPPGDAEDVLPPTLWPDPQWRAGEPDMVLEMTGAFEIPATGPDIYRYFVIPFVLDRERAVSAVEFRPGDETVVHHANIFVDYAGKARRRDALDPAPGFSVFGTGGFFDYDGEAESWGIGGWTPGVDPYVLPEGHALWLPAGAGDLVIEIHYHLTGKATRDRSRVGLHFTERPVDRWIDGLVMGTEQLAIPPETDEYWRHVWMEVPIDVTLIDISPHMHYLGAEAKAIATLPDGRRIPLVHVPEWDLRWQNVFFFREPLRLPAGSRIDGWLRFDNRSDNPANPTLPPKTVTWGWGSDEEMAEFWIGFVLDDWRQRDRIVDAANRAWYRDPAPRGGVPDLTDPRAGR